MTWSISWLVDPVAGPTARNGRIDPSTKVAKSGPACKPAGSLHIASNAGWRARNGVPVLQADELVSSIRQLRASFVDAAYYRTTVPTYFGGQTALGRASDDPARHRVPAEALQQRFAAA
ncbi:MAG: hypothetical protein KDJ16_05110 [Hyphomicrobiales bacterium]|nr:hypothetical protein [Hyphomicrobiales bacterium]